MEKIRIFEAFAGYGSQSMALEVLRRKIGLDYSVVGISEIDPAAIKAYYAARDERLDPESDKYSPELVEYLRGGGTYEPTPSLLARYPNYGDISTIDWECVPDFNLLSYSFPCTDISNAGLQMGLSEGSGTRSSLLWECKHAIEKKRPKWLLMENVRALLSKKMLPDFQRWIDLLQSYGYESYYKLLNAVDFGIPQARNRVFMISTLTGVGYVFPDIHCAIPCIEDILEDDVDESFYLSESRIARIQEHCARKISEGCGFKSQFKKKEEISTTITGKYGQRETDTYLIVEDENKNSVQHNQG